MDAIERAIRSAFLKGDPEDRAFRERVYRSAYGALERAIAANPNIDAQGAERRRALFRKRVVEIEQEFVPAVPVSGPAAPEIPEPDVPQHADGVPDAARSYGEDMLDFAPDRDRAGPAQAAAPDISAAEAHRARRPARRRGRALGWALIVVTALALLGAGLWWIAPVALRDAPPRFPSPPLETEEFDPGEPARVGTGERPGGSGGIPASAGDYAWIGIFDPVDPTRARAGAGTSAELVDASGAPALRVRSGDAAGSISFDIGRGTLQRLAGDRAVFSVDLAGVDGEAQVSVSCDFAGLGDCGRRRYLIGAERAEFLFEVDLPSGAPEGAGSIVLNPDILGEGRAVDVFRIQVARP